MTTTPVAGRLPVGRWVFMPLADDGVWMARSEAFGCWICLEGIWHECLPPSNNPLTYDMNWFKRG